MKQPEVTVERDAAMRGWEITVFREDGPSVVVFMGDRRTPTSRGVLAVTPFEEEITVTGGELPLEMGRVHTYGNGVVCT